MRLSVLLVVGIAGCAGVPPVAPLDSSEEHATLTMVSNNPGVDLPASLASLDGIDLKGFHSTISVKPGKRTVGYVCQAVLDGPPPPTITAEFEPRKAYLLRCSGAKAALEQQ